MGSLADIEGSAAALQLILAALTEQSGFTSVKISPPPLGSGLYAVIFPGHHQKFLSRHLDMIYPSI